ncbi:helix-turn-helix domain-containing protein [Paenibacillus pinihumi]|uniref:helix-turn-helix domain-containing protein n=1 Tax=Paenibacillus pinihumi TaxID=669462 RepID=UPI0004171B1B|nr:helix-turn-helix domain-containing protein [Paenibacillus pinihumi]
MSQYDRFESYASPAYGTIFAGHFNETDRYTTSRPGGMEDWLMTYTLSGEGYFHTPSGINQCYEGDLALLRSGVPHEYGAAPGKQWNFIWAHFPGLNETHYLPGEELIVQHLGNEHLQNRVYRALRNVLLDSREQRPLWRELCENEIRGILLLIADRSRDKLDPRVEQTLHYLSRHMREPIKIETVARAVGLSASRLSHLFKATTGTTLVHMLSEMRIRQASALIRHAGRTASEAAYEVGFQNYNHFASQFQRQMGTSPREYRKQFVKTVEQGMRRE